MTLDRCRHGLRLTLPALLMLTPFGVLAAEPMKPGLWQVSVHLSAEAMAAIPKGTTVPGLVGNVMTRQICVTPAQAQSLAMFSDIGDERCTVSKKGFVDAAYSLDYVCNVAAKKGTGNARTVLTGGVSFTSVIEFRGVVDGKSMARRDESSGKWLNASCGSVR